MNTTVTFEFYVEPSTGGEQTWLVTAELDFETNLRSEIWAVHIGRQIGLSSTDVEQHVQRIIEASKKQISGPIDVAAQDAFDPDAA